ncbi:unnamed protein product [Dovyalis caffra]|uniref:Major facilitator superfamily (MFS) profile domain-containing protein n=1 Tax=Dovyalis caffra TaxID=77055 RepID=A0AAV1R9J6_9ROSI|nr:unnamed protein product [Dovyalis caffra]
MQAVPLFISEIAPAEYRGGFNLCFQLLITIGILFANVTNYVTSKLHPYGWRISLGIAAFPALLLLLGSITIVETPTSLIEQGKNEEGLYYLKKLRGVDNVDKEYEEIFQAVEFSKQIKHPFKNLRKQSSRPQLVCGALIQIFQQFTGISVVMLYAPVLFQTMGLGENASLMSAIMTNTVKPIGTVFAIFVVDKFGRRALLIEAAIQMFISLGAIGVILAMHLHSTNVVSKHDAILVIILVCVFLAGFAWSWGPLGWLIPSEIFPIETRSAGFSVAPGLRDCLDEQVVLKVEGVEFNIQINEFDSVLYSEFSRIEFSMNKPNMQYDGDRELESVSAEEECQQPHNSGQFRADTSVDIIDSLSLYDRDNLGPILDLIHTASESNIQQQQVHKFDQTQPANSLGKYGQFRIVDTIDNHDTVWSITRRNVLGPHFQFLCVLNLPLTQTQARK